MDESGLAQAVTVSRIISGHDLGNLLGGTQSGATRIVDDGQILGWSENAAGLRAPVRWNAAGRIEALRLPWLSDTANSHANADVSQRGEVVGSATGDAMYGWYWSKAAGMLDLRDQVPSSMENFAYAINAHGTVTGAACSGLGCPSGPRNAGAAWRPPATTGARSSARERPRTA